MAYYTGVAQNMAELEDALVYMATQGGWGYSGGIFSKGASRFRLGVINLKRDIYYSYSDFDVLALGGADIPFSRENRFRFAVAGQIPLPTEIMGQPAFPCKYHGFVFEFELYFWFEALPSYWQWLAFGESRLAGLPSPAPWFGGSFFVESQAKALAQYCTRGEAWCRGYELFPGARDFKGSAVWDPWKSEWRAEGYGSDCLAPLREVACSRWNSTPVLLPLRNFVDRGEGKLALVVDLEHARHARLDYNAPGDVITLGEKRWMLLPWFRKTPVKPLRDFWGRAVGEQYDYCTGPYGIAIRYEGP